MGNFTLDAPDDPCCGLNTDYDLTVSVVCGLNLIFGNVFCLFGYRCFKAIMFLTGLVFASTLVYLVCLEEDLLPAFGNAGVALGTGFLFGLITMMVYYVGLFVMGLHTGLLIGIIVMAIVEQQLMVTNMWISVGVLLGCALLAAVLTLSYQKALTIVGTSLYGGAVLAASMDYYIENWRMVHWLWDRVKLKTSPQPCWFSWLLLAVWPLMVVAGTAVQTFITGRDFYHKYQGPNSARRRRQRSRSHSRSRKPLTHQNRHAEVVPSASSSASSAIFPGPRRYRYIYQVRTAHGDVISQRYIQALRNMVAVPHHAAKTASLQSAYALCSAESDTEANAVGTWSTQATTNDVVRPTSSSTPHNAEAAAAAAAPPHRRP